MADRPRSGYGKVASGVGRWLLRNPIVALASHWTFQSLLYMDATERWFKLGLDVLWTIGGGLLLNAWVSWPIACLISFPIAHTINFLFNGHLLGVLKHFGIIRTSYEIFAQYIDQLTRRACDESCIQSLAIYGSVARQEWSPTSDLDVRLLRKPGIHNGLRACWFTMRERSRAVLSLFPLDIYVLDSEESYRKLRQDERDSNFIHRSL
jgi:hypothetical protein